MSSAAKTRPHSAQAAFPSGNVGAAFTLRRLRQYLGQYTNENDTRPSEKAVINMDNRLRDTCDHHAAMASTNECLTIPNAMSAKKNFQSRRKQTVTNQIATLRLGHRYSRHASQQPNAGTTNR